jgi:ABC-2 type transport system ATP-binding protein
VPFIEVRSLVKSFGQVRALTGVGFTAERGRITALLGRNGAGKTTALRILLGLVHADAGSATVDGRPYADLEQPLRTLGAVGEVIAFHPRRSGRDYLRLVATLLELPRERVEMMLAATELAEDADRPVGGYSLGMRQRLGLAAALLPEPAGLVLDEPMNGLDPLGMRWLRRMLRTEADGGRAVLVASHLLGEMSQLADDIAVIDRGRLLRQATSEELIAMGSGSLEEAFVELTAEAPS